MSVFFDFFSYFVFYPSNYYFSTFQSLEILSEEDDDESVVSEDDDDEDIDEESEPAPDWDELEEQCRNRICSPFFKITFTYLH